jgi:hypothetical protein
MHARPASAFYRLPAYFIDIFALLVFPQRFSPWKRKDAEKKTGD